MTQSDSASCRTHIKCQKHGISPAFTTSADHNINKSNKTTHRMILLESGGNQTLESYSPMSSLNRFLLF